MNMNKRTAFIGVILFVLSFSLSNDTVIASPYIDQNYLAQYRPIPGVKYKRNRWYNKGLKKFQNGDYQSSIDIFSKYINVMTEIIRLIESFKIKYSIPPKNLKKMI